MSYYTTGELAKLCDVSVRTVQYYDDRGILKPSAMSEGGRRMFSENDLQKLQVICFLKSAGLPIKSIAAILSNEKPESIISLFLDEQKCEIEAQMAEFEKKMKLIDGINREKKYVRDLSVKSIGDIANIMEEKGKLKKMRLTMLLTGLAVSALQITSICLWVSLGLWWLFAVWAAVAIVYGIVVSKYYFDHVGYICPECHEVFKPSFKQSFFAYHTPRMRRLTCPKCGEKNLCVEVYRAKEK